MKNKIDRILAQLTLTFFLMVYFSRGRFYLLPLSASGGRMKDEHCSFLYRSRHFYTWANSLWTSLGRVHISICARFCSACRLHPFAARLDRIQLGSKSLEIFGLSSDQFFWLNLLLTHSQSIAKPYLTTNTGLSKRHTTELSYRTHLPSQPLVKAMTKLLLRYSHIQT